MVSSNEDPQCPDQGSCWLGAVEQISNHVHRTAYKFALFTGLRRCEPEALEWDRVSDGVYVPTTKSGRGFWLALTPDILVM